LISLLILSGCNPTKKLKEGEYLLEKNVVVDRQSELEKDVVETYIRQKPNRKLFRLFYFHTWLYNTVNVEKNKVKKEKRNEKWKKKNEKREAKANKRNVRRDAKHDKRNRRRLARGRKALPPRRAIVAKKKNLDDPTFGERIQEIGEAAVVLDTFLANSSAQQIRKYYMNNGYFNAKVRDSIIIEPVKRGVKKKKKSEVYYLITPGPAYFIRNITYKIDDTLLARFVLADTAACKIKSGMRYQGEQVILERERIYKQQINNGYYEFAQDFIYFLVDTNLNQHKLDITIGIKNFGFKTYSRKRHYSVPKPHPLLHQQYLRDNRFQFL
jgi:hypothetical protein